MLGRLCASEGQYDIEEAVLAFVESYFVAVLIRIEDRDLPAERRGWFLEVGFGPFQGEGILFAASSLHFISSLRQVRAQSPVKSHKR